MSFQWPYLLFALALVPGVAALYLLAQRRRRAYALRFANFERLGAVGNVQVRNLIAPERGIALVAFAASTVPDFGEPWQGKGLTWELLSAALCPAS